MNVQSNSGAVHIPRPQNRAVTVYSEDDNGEKIYPVSCGRKVKNGKLTHDSATCPRCKNRSRS